ncbi:hypothetical protein [Corynebacterium uterequi]|uniref:hypothetical protein n=1 Tax=Corynebacterium uterequi TaxID=1072256 RepID=UPI000640C7D6|nr:hypothetical protein [Corynebacterium uterequi]
MEGLGGRRGCQAAKTEIADCEQAARAARRAAIDTCEFCDDHGRAHIAMVIHKRHGNNNPADQYATMTLENLIKLLDGTP